VTSFHLAEVNALSEFLTREFDRRSGHPTDPRYWEELFVNEDARRCVFRYHSNLRHCMGSRGIMASPAIYCDCYLTGMRSTWSWRWLAVAASPLPPANTNGVGMTV